MPTKSVQSIQFTTTAPPTLARLTRSQKTIARALELAESGSAEKTVVRMTLGLVGPSQGIEPRQAAVVWGHLEPIYQSMAKDPSFDSIPSALPVSFASKRSKTAHAFLSLPEKLNAQTPWLVFLHGDGGNFLYYLHQMRRFFPDAVVILPTHQIRWRGAKAALVQDAIKHVEKAVGVKANRPMLVALSGAGPTAFGFYAQNPKAWSGLVALATAPGEALQKTFKADHRVLMINGSLDRRFPIQSVRRQAKVLVGRKVQLQIETWKADHFLMLTHAPQVQQHMRRFVFKNKK